MGEKLTRGDLEWVASAIRYPEEFLRLGLPPRGAVSPKAWHALKVLREHLLERLAQAARGAA